MARTPKNKTPAAASSSSFLQQLETLRGFITAMGMKHTESQMTDALRMAGYNVELALERLLGGGDVAAASSANIGSSAKKRRSETSSPAAAAATAPKSIKRNKPSPTNNTSYASLPTPAPSSSSSRLLLCKRWTVATSKSIRGTISHGEQCDFAENYKHHPHSNNNHNYDPIVRFRTRDAQGSLNRNLCEMLAPLLRLSENNAQHVTNGSRNNGMAVPLIHLSGETLMEDHSLIIGSDIPVNLSVYINHPQWFFGLFEQNTMNESSQFFGKKNNKSAWNSKRGKGCNNIAECAFRLLQWAEWGDEEIEVDYDDKIDLEKKDSASTNNSKVKDEDDVSSFASSTTRDLIEEEYQELETSSQEVDELNAMVVKTSSSSDSVVLRELSDPIGFKNVVKLRPYQRQALYWMCRREGLTLKELEMDDGKADEDDGEEEMELLAELAGEICRYSRMSNELQVVWGGKSHGIACDCGPVVVGDDEVASRAVPVVDYEKEVEERDKKKYVHHPLWKRRFLANEELTKVYAFYVNELLGIAAASPPNPPKQCVGGILADAMGLGMFIICVCCFLLCAFLNLNFDLLGL
jgi:hypothetical protein